jgi:small subunit ribosomal protein S17
MPQQPARRRRTKLGRVVSDRMDKTIVVAVERLARHRVYKRVIRLTSKFQAHDEENAARLGDHVLIEESRPLSRRKRWRLVEVVTRAGAPIEPAAEEPETTEAISRAAHPGKRRAREAAAAAEAAGETAGTTIGADELVEAAELSAGEGDRSPAAELEEAGP